jgi:hypothetical protein
MEQEYNSRLCARSFFEGLSGQSNRNNIIPKDADTLLALKDENQCQHLHLLLSEVGTLEVQNGLQLVQKESKNFASYKEEKKDPANENKRDYALPTVLFLKY